MSCLGSAEGCSEISVGEPKRAKLKPASTGSEMLVTVDASFVGKKRMFSERRLLCSPPAQWKFWTVRAICRASQIRSERLGGSMPSFAENRSRSDQGYSGRRGKG